MMHLVVGFEQEAMLPKPLPSNARCRRWISTARGNGGCWKTADPRRRSVRLFVEDL